MDRKVKIALLFLVGAVLATVPAFYYLPGKSFTIKGKYNQRENMVAIGSANIPAGEDDSRIVLAAVGDIMLSRAVERKMIAKKDWKYPFLETAEITSGADITFGNLETTILPGARVLDMSFIFRADPKALEGLEVAGFDVLSLANNHTMNFGYSGLEATLQNLDGVGIGHIGAGLSEKSIYAPVIKEVEGVKIGFLAYTYAREQSHSIDGNIYGTAYANTDKMKDQVSELRNSADIVVISMHMGEEYQTSPNTVQKNFARAAVDAGAELVIGHHPHVVETFEKYNDGYIIYSLGNFVFDQMWSEETRLGAIAEITFENNKISDIRFVPVKIFDYAQPKLADGVDKDKILERLEANGD
jgi:poly-gamma-glutamate synthesis protein (capsule biosynthesis protein)